MSSGRYLPPSPSRAALPPIGPPTAASPIRSAEQQNKYFFDLLEERRRLGPFAQVLPHCFRMLNQEINRVTRLFGNASVLDQSGLQHASPLASGGIYSHGGANLNRWVSPFPSEMPSLMKPSSAQNLFGCQANLSGPVVKRTFRVDIPVEQYPNFNFVGRLLGPRGNTLKRIEASTNCRVHIRGRGSLKDPREEENLIGKPGHEHLNEPLHLIVEAELPVGKIDAMLMEVRVILENLLKPVNESEDLLKKQQFRELAMLNGALHEEGSRMSGAMPHNSVGMKRSKTSE